MTKLQSWKFEEDEKEQGTLEETRSQSKYQNVAIWHSVSFLDVALECYLVLTL
jgi:hypothetical protein